MAYTLLASQVPIPVGPSSALTIVAGNNETSTSNPVPLGYGGTIHATPFNQGQARIGNAAMFGGHGFGIIDGLGLSVSSGLLLAVAAGHAMMSDTVEFAGGTITLPDNTANVRLWLKQDGTLNARTDTVLPSGWTPATTAVYIGRAVTAAGVISGIDLSGVGYLANGPMIRYTADKAPPTDTPSATGPVFLTSCPAGLFLWAAGRYWRLPGPLEVTKTSLAAGDTDYIPAGYQTIVQGVFSVAPGATLTVDGSLIVNP